MSEALACRHYISDRIDSGYLLCSISRLMNDDTQRIRIETSLEGVAYRDGYARPNHLKSPQFFEEGYRGSGVSGWIRQTKPSQFFRRGLLREWSIGIRALHQ